VESCVPGDTGIVDQHINVTHLGNDVGDGGLTGVIIGYIKFKNGNAVFFTEFCSGFIVTGIAGGDFVPCVF